MSKWTDIAITLAGWVLSLGITIYATSLEGRITALRALLAQKVTETIYSLDSTEYCIIICGAHNKTWLARADKVCYIEDMPK